MQVYNTVVSSVCYIDILISYIMVYGRVCVNPAFFFFFALEALGIVLIPHFSLPIATNTVLI